MEIDEIYERYFKDVLHYMYGLSRDASIAEEITQETFFKALKAIDSYDGRKDIKAWLFTIAKNTFYTYCRQKKKYVDIEYMEDNESDSITFEEKVIDKEILFQIHKYLHGMQEPYKEVFNLRIFGELPFDKIGAIFGKSSGWARVTYYRAKNMIIEYMEEMDDEKN